MGLKSHVNFLESELQAFRSFRYSIFKEANERAAQLKEERDALSLSFKGRDDIVLSCEHLRTV
ncbi:hypothetical protein A2U01_0097542 [Trifolium medium]|nr:hypothetical protein [Trifolium medium]